MDGSKVWRAGDERRAREAGVRPQSAADSTEKISSPSRKPSSPAAALNVREIDPATMESRKVSGLYFAGEVIDVDAHTGGYNLQIAWAIRRAGGSERRLKKK